MKTRFFCPPSLLSIVVLGLVFLATGLSFATEPYANVAQTSKSVLEHPGREVGDKKDQGMTADVVKKSIREHVTVISKASKGACVVRDGKLNKDWRLTLSRIHDPVRSFEKDGMTIYFACCDFKSMDSQDILDIDFWMVPKGNKLEVIDTKIHKVNGEPRYGYEGIKIKEIK